ncbi:MAG TPA: HAMP domain-containing protein [Tissierellia bacterium]|nr:HAMP domain-containing protein [Tissierellia bacterium]
MKNFRIRKKLLLSFGSLGILILILCTVALFSLIEANSRLKSLYDNNLIATIAVGRMREIYQHERSVTKDIVIIMDGISGATSDAPDAVSSPTMEAVEKLNDLDKEMLANFELYEATITTQENREIFDKIKTLYLGDYSEFKNQLKEYVVEGNFSSANSHLLSDSGINDSMTDYLDQIETINKEYAETAMLKSKQAAVLTYTTGAVFILVAVFWLLYLVKNLDKMIAGQIEKLVVATNELAKGNVDVSVEVESEDEIGQLAKDFNHMIGGIRELVKVVEAIELGDLTVKSVPRSEKDVMMLSLNKTIDNLNRLLGSFNIAAHQVSTGINEVLNTSQYIASGATEQAASIEELTGAINNVLEKANENVEHMENASRHMDEADEGIKKNNEYMRDMVNAMKRIEDFSEKILGIAKLIDDIAFQTNILALNATIEAAHAGEAGKGFVVVADEVRNLALKSGQAAKEASQLIADTVEAVKNGTDIAVETAAVLSEVSERMSEVSEFVSKIEDVSYEQKQAIELITFSIEQISNVVQNNAASAEESSSAVEELSAQADLLMEEISKFKLLNEDGVPEILSY